MGLQMANLYASRGCPTGSWAAGVSEERTSPSEAAILKQLLSSGLQGRGCCFPFLGTLKCELSRFREMLWDGGYLDPIPNDKVIIFMRRDSFSWTWPNLLRSWSFFSSGGAWHITARCRAKTHAYRNRNRTEPAQKQQRTCNCAAKLTRLTNRCFPEILGCWNHVHWKFHSTFLKLVLHES